MPSSSVHGGKKQVKKAKNRVTLLGCCNTSGSYKLPLAFVHKSARHRCFKTAVCYFSQRKAWLDTALLETWFHEKFVPHIKKFCQDEGNDFCFLIMHRLIHQLKLTSRDGKVTTKLLPPNTTSLLQPLDQWVLEALKQRSLYGTTLFLRTAILH